MLLFENGIIHTQDTANPSAECVLIDDSGKIAFVGKRTDVNPPAGTRIVDLAGRTLLPGFNDAHVHVWKLGLLLTVQVDARGAAAPDLETIIGKFKQRADQTAPGVWLTGRGYNEAMLPERRHPTRHDLDLASTEHPIALTRTCGHMIVANSRALELAGVTRDTPDPAGGVIVRDERGEPTGLLMETAQGLVTRVMTEPDDATMKRGIQAAMTHQLALGITSATDPLLAPSHLRAYRQLEDERALTVRINGLPIRRPDGGTETLPLPERYVSDTLRIDCVKFFGDGGLSGATAAVSFPYKVTGSHGVLRFEDDELRALAQEAHDAGFRIASHAIGDVAIEQIISVYEAIHRANPQPLRHRIEHLGLPNADHLARCKALNIIIAPQTIFLYALGATYKTYLPDDQLPRAYPVRAMLDHGLTIALSSDAPVVPDDNPLLGMKAAIDRLDQSGAFAIGADQAITAQEALYGYTMGGAIASGDDGNRGSLTVGKWGDVIVLSGDPLTTPAAELPALKVEQTYVGGQLAYAI